MPVTSATVTGVIATNHRGDLANNDSGIGFKSESSQVTWTNCESYANLKGWDLGEQHGDNADITYKVVNGYAHDNSWGINFNSAATSAYLGTVTFYAINCLVVNNTESGMNTYAGPYTFYCVNNVFDRNGLAAQSPPLYNGAQLTITPNDASDTSVCVARIYNNIFRNQAAGGGNNNTSILFNKYFETSNKFTLDSDYNSYQQTGANTLFCMWAGYGGVEVQFTFGGNGPGHATGNWYSWYGNSTTPPASGTGHFHSDANSKGTGATDTSLPNLNANYIPLAAYPGANLTSKPWYIAAMGTDRAGNPRSSWTMGAYEFASIPTKPESPANLRIIP
jgi:hypothetical protein